MNIQIADILDDKYKIIKEIGSGAFGNVYLGNIINSNTPLAIKIEKIEKTDTNKSRIESEYEIYKHIKGNGIPKIYFYNNNCNGLKMLGMEFLGPSLEDLFVFCKRSFCLKTVCLIAIQILDRIEHVHNLGIIHRDIKPENFLIGTNNKKSTIYIVDFGLSKRYIESNKHIEFNNKKNFTGTYRYSSIRNHRGIEQSRRDDLESIGYMLCYFYNGMLPWQGLQIQDKIERNNKIYKKKRTTAIANIIKDLPEEFYDYIQYCRLLRFSENPDYNYLKTLFKNILDRHNIKMDNIFDWNLEALLKKKKNNGIL